MAPRSFGRALMKGRGARALVLGSTAAPLPFISPSRTNWTHLVPPSVLTGHVSSLPPEKGAQAPLWRGVGIEERPSTAPKRALQNHG
jgi:hypothetical protein